MAVLDLFMQNTANASNLNAGTDTTEPTTTYQGSATGQSSGGTLTFTSGTVFTGVSVGTWVSIYNTGDTATRFTGQVASIDGTATTITVTYNPTSFYIITGFGLANAITGTASGAYCRIGGAWKDLGITVSPGVMAGTTPSLSGAMTVSTYSGLRINVKAGTYNNAALVVFPVGLAAKPIWWRGYYSTLTGTPGSAMGYTGDIDNCANVNGTLVTPAGTTVSGATRPQFVSTLATANQDNFSCAGWVQFENLEFSGSSNNSVNGVLRFTAGVVYQRMVRCRVTNLAGVAGNIVNSTYSSYLTAIGCLFVYTGTGVSNGVIAGNFTALGCGFRTNYSGFLPLSSYHISFCTFEGLNSTTGNAVNHNPAAVGTFSFTNNIIYQFATGFNYNNTTLGAHPLVANNIVSNCTTAVNIIASTANPWTLQLLSNGFYSTAQLGSNIWEAFQRGAVTETSAPFTSAGTNHDYSLASGALSRQAGFPGQFEV